MIFGIHGLKRCSKQRRIETLCIPFINVHKLPMPFLKPSSNLFTSVSWREQNWALSVENTDVFLQQSMKVGTDYNLQARCHSLDGARVKLSFFDPLLDLDEEVPYEILRVEDSIRL